MDIREGFNEGTVHKYVHACVLSCLSHVRLFATPCTIVHQAPLSMGFPRQCYWNVTAISEKYENPLEKVTWLYKVSHSYSCLGEQRVHYLLLFSHEAVSNSLWSHGLKHSRHPCSLVSPRVCSNSYPLGQWCYTIISFSIAPFSSCPNLSQHQGLSQWDSSSY